MAAKRKAAAPSGQLFPEALQHQRQLTMTVMVPAETARVIAAEQARRDRAAKGTPNRRRPKGTRLANPLHRSMTGPGAGTASAALAATKNTPNLILKNARRKRARNSTETHRELLKRALYLQGRAEHADKVGDRVAAREYQEAAERVIARMKSAAKCTCPTPNKGKRRVTTTETKTVKRVSANKRRTAKRARNVQRRGYVITLSKKETQAWWGGGFGARASIRAAFERIGDGIVKKHPGAPIMVHDARGMMVESWGRGVRL